ncbi:MAG: CBM35 domain-containing protein, partial [Ignavibacteriaceae bacterium]
MRLYYMFTLFILFAAVVFNPVQEVYAQGDEMIVEWQDNEGNIIPNALRSAILADTLADGSRANLNRVYKLRKGGYYWNDETIENVGWHLRVVGEDPDPNDPNGHPAVFQQVAREDGTLNGRMITGNGSITFRNIYFIGADDGGSQGALYQPIQIDASDSRFEIDNCIFERNSFAIIAWTGSNNDIFITNNIYRNLIETPPTQLWSGRGLTIWSDQDTVIIENNTFFNIAFSAFQLESGVANYLRFNHNTLVNIGRNINTSPWLKTAYFTNNLIVNAFWDGEANNTDELLSPNRDPRAYTSGIFHFGALPTRYGLDEGRTILFSNSAAYLDPRFETWYADSIRRQYFIGPVLEEDYVTPFEGIAVQDTTWLTERPDFPTYPTDDIINNMIAYIEEVRSSQYYGGETPSTTYFWQYPVIGGDTCHTCPSWPANTPRGVPENFSYTTASLLTASTDGLPLGDLNWFPTQKATFESNIAQYVAAIEAIVSAPVIEPAGSIEVESGTLAGGAEIVGYDYPVAIRLQEGPSITWTYDAPAAGSYTLRFHHNMEIGSPKGQKVHINGQPYTDGDPDVMFEGDATSWLTTDVEVTLQQGSNEIQVVKSWGWMYFGDLDIVQGGNVLTTLSAIEAVLNGDVMYEQVNDTDPAPPSDWFFVNMPDANSSVSVSFESAAGGTYALAVTYTAEADQNFELYLNSALASSVTLEATEGEWESQNFTNLAFNAGTNQIELRATGGGIGVDKVDFFTLVTGVLERPGLPEGFALSQNYPNPFNPMTNIEFDLGRMSNVSLTIYNILGQKVA